MENPRMIFLRPGVWKGMPPSSLYKVVHLASIELPQPFIFEDNHGCAVLRRQIQRGACRAFDLVSLRASLDIITNPPHATR